MFEWLTVDQPAPPWNALDQEPILGLEGVALKDHEDAEVF